MTDYVVTCGGKKYLIDLEAVMEFCLQSEYDNLKEHELTESYEWDDEQREMQIMNRITRDVKGGDEQNDMLSYDLVKLFILRLLDNESPANEFNMDFSTALAMNTLINYNILVEIKEEE